MPWFISRRYRCRYYFKVLEY